MVGGDSLTLRARQAEALALALALILAAAGCGDGEPPGRRVLVLGLDGLDPDAVELLAAEGALPTFERLRREGACGPLRAGEPLLSPVLWTTIATGRPPEDHGIGHFRAVDPHTGGSQPVTSELRRVESLWTIASAAGRPAAVVGWWASWPPEPIDGWIVSDRAAYHFLFREGLEPEAAAARSSGGRITWPPELESEIAPMLRRPADVGAAELAGFAAVGAEELERPFDFEDELAHLRWAVATAESYRNLGLHLWRSREPDLAMVYVEAPDSVSHLFGHLFRARGLAGDLAAQQERFGGAVEAVYRLADGVVADFLDAVGEDATLVVLSDHGFALGALHDDPSRALDLRRVSERFHRPDGVLCLAGAGVRPGVEIEGARQLDVAPTVLALLGLPAARDMPGRVLEEALTLEPPRRIRTYERGRGRPLAGGEEGAPSVADEALLAHLRSLGYLHGGSEDGEPPTASSEPGAPPRSPGGERVLAALHFEAGRYREAEAAYRELLARSPHDPALHNSLAGVLGAQERYEEAEAELAEALRLAPIEPSVHHNLGALAENRGDVAAAVEHYREALLYRPSYEPSRRALLRLTGSAESRPPRGEAERRARELAERAAAAARRGDYRAAGELLDRAVEEAPAYALVWQYRANVAYLSGDRDGARRALERALELEPDNRLLRENLARLAAGGE